MEVIRLPVLSDNYVWLLHEPSSRQTAVVDPAVHEPVLEALQERWAAAGRAARQTAGHAAGHAAGTCCMAAAAADGAGIAADAPERAERQQGAAQHNAAAKGCCCTSLRPWSCHSCSSTSQQSMAPPPLCACSMQAQSWQHHRAAAWLQHTALPSPHPPTHLTSLPHSHASPPASQMGTSYTSPTCPPGHCPPAVALSAGSSTTSYMTT